MNMKTVKLMQSPTAVLTSWTKSPNLESVFMNLNTLKAIFKVKMQFENRK